MKSATAPRPITSISSSMYRMRPPKNERQREILAWLGDSLDDAEKRKLSRQGGVDVSQERLLEVKLLNLARDRYRSLQEKEFRKQRFLDIQQRKMMRTLPHMLDKINLDQYRRKSLTKMEQLREKSAQLRREMFERMRSSARGDASLTLANDSHENEWDWIIEDNASNVSDEYEGNIRLPSGKTISLRSGAHLTSSFTSIRDKRVPQPPVMLSSRSVESLHPLPEIGNQQTRLNSPKKVSFLPNRSTHPDNNTINTNISLPLHEFSPQQRKGTLVYGDKPTSTSVSATSSAVSRRRSHYSSPSLAGSRASSSRKFSRFQGITNRQVQSSIARTQASQDPRCQELLKALVPISRPCSGKRLPGIVKSIDALYLPPKHPMTPVRKTRAIEDDVSD